MARLGSRGTPREPDHRRGYSGPAAGPWGDIAAASMLPSVPPVALVVGLQRYLVRGLLTGALRE